MEKIFIQFFVVFQLIGLIFCFISYPFSAGNLLSTLYTSLDIKASKFAINIHKNSIPGAECDRKCSKNDHKICHFKFTLEYYQALGGACNKCLRHNKTDCFRKQCITADGIERTIMSINRQLPGPAIHVCKSDLIIVDVDNQMDGTATTIHWHGFLQHETPYDDGVAFLTQCPVSYGTKYRYMFHAKQTGTHFYHSHTGQHKANGIYGPLIVRDVLDVKEMLYDFDLPDFFILCSDWMHRHAEEFVPGLPSTVSLFESILINGYGRYFNKSTQSRIFTPMKIYTVTSHKRYLFRLINAASNVCPFQLQIESHNLTIIATDGNELESIIADTIFINSGERIDFVVNTVNRIDDYFIRVRALSPCNDTVEDFALLRYGKVNKVDVDFVDKKIPKISEIYQILRIFNYPGTKEEAMAELVDGRSKNVDKELIDSKSNEIFHLFMATPKLDNEVLFGDGEFLKFMVTSDRLNNNNIGTVNNISLILPTFPLLSNKNSINDSMFCDYSNTSTNLIKSCIHRVKVKLNSVIEFLLIDTDDNSRHPFHLHGHKFYVIDSGKYSDGVLSTKSLIGSYGRVTLKDTATIPQKGFLRIKFKANNPGFWLAHCHFDYHMAVGMGFILQVGDAVDMKGASDEFDRNCNGFVPERFKI